MNAQNDPMYDEALEFVRKWNNEEIILKPESAKVGYRYVKTICDNRKIKSNKEQGSYDLMLAQIVTSFKRLALKRWPIRNDDEAYDFGYNQASCVQDIVEAVDMGKAKQLFVPGPAYDLKLEKIISEIAQLNQKLLDQSTDILAKEGDNRELRAALADLNEKIPKMFSTCPKCGFYVEEGISEDEIPSKDSGKFDETYRT